MTYPTFNVSNRIEKAIERELEKIPTKELERVVDDVWQNHIRFNVTEMAEYELFLRKKHGKRRKKEKKA